MATDTQSLQTLVELLVDGHSVRDVLIALRETCDAKADHLRTNWQDSHAAKCWDKAAIQCGNVAERVEV